MDESLSAYRGPTMTVFSSRTLGRMIWATLLPDLTYWHRAAQCISQAGVWEWHPVIPLKVRPPPRPLLCTGDFKIKEAIHHLQHVLLRPSGERKGEIESQRRMIGLQLVAFITQHFSFAQV